MAQGKWRDARRQKQRQQEVWAKMFKLEDDNDEDENGKKGKQK